MNFQDYLNIKALNASTLKGCANGDQQGYDTVNGLIRFGDAAKAAMNFGSAAHTYLLEPHLFDDEWAVSPKFDGRTSEGKNARKLFEETHSGKNVITDVEFDIIKKFQKNCFNNSSVLSVLDTFEKEKTYQWKAYDVEMKARLDLVHEDNNVIIDLKTTKDASPKEFLNDLISRNYHIQMFHYSHVLIKPNIYVIALENTTGEVALYNITNIVYSDFTKAKYDEAVKTYFKVIEMKERPAKYSKEIISLELPYWAK